MNRNVSSHTSIKNGSGVIRHDTTSSVSATSATPIESTTLGERASFGQWCALAKANAPVMYVDGTEGVLLKANRYRHAVKVRRHARHVTVALEHVYAVFFAGAWREPLAWNLVPYRSDAALPSVPLPVLASAPASFLPDRAMWVPY